MNNIEVRPVISNDAPFLQQLMNDSQVMAALNEVPSSVEVWAEAIVGWSNDPDEEDHIILDGGMPIGWIGINGLSSDTRQAFIKVIALLPMHQGRGIGQHVMNEIIQDLRLRGFVSIGLYTDCSNERAQHCYIRSGFEISGETAQKMPNGTTVRRYRMERSL